jgi:hypothetical protein
MRPCVVRTSGTKIPHHERHPDGASPSYRIPPSRSRHRQPAASASQQRGAGERERPPADPAHVGSARHRCVAGEPDPWHRRPLPLPCADDRGPGHPASVRRCHGRHPVEDHGCAGLDGSGAVRQEAGRCGSGLQPEEAGPAEPPPAGGLRRGHGRLPGRAVAARQCGWTGAASRRRWSGLLRTWMFASS